MAVIHQWRGEVEQTRTWAEATIELASERGYAYRVAMGRILSGRPKIKWFEAGMDLDLAEDEYDSFRIFQGRILEEYRKMAPEFGFTVMDASAPIESQQESVRRIVSEKIDLAAFRRRSATRT